MTRVSNQLAGQCMNRWRLENKSSWCGFKILSLSLSQILAAVIVEAMLKLHSCFLVPVVIPLALLVLLCTLPANSSDPHQSTTYLAPRSPLASV